MMVARLRSGWFGSSGDAESEIWDVILWWSQQDAPFSPTHAPWAE